TTFITLVPWPSTMVPAETVQANVSFLSDGSDTITANGMIAPGADTLLGPVTSSVGQLGEEGAGLLSGGSQPSHFAGGVAPGGTSQICIVDFLETFSTNVILLRSTLGAEIIFCNRSESALRTAASGGTKI